VPRVTGQREASAGLRGELAGVGSQPVEGGNCGGTPGGKDDLVEIADRLGRFDGAEILLAGAELVFDEAGGGCLVAAPQEEELEQEVEADFAHAVNAVAEP